MGQGQIKKGFFFYFGLFVLALVAVFLICLVVMMFNPGKTVLWMQYFTGDDAIVVTKTTDTKSAINFNSLNAVEINCSYADVSIQKNRDYEQTGIYIINNSKGFAAASSAVQFDYNVYYEGSVLKIDVTEPTGFMYFSKDVKVIIHAHTEDTVNFSNTKFKVTTGAGDVNIGGNFSKDPTYVGLSAITAETTSGNISFSNLFVSSNVSELALKTVSGNIYSGKEVSYGASNKGAGLDVSCDVSIETEKGTVELDALILNGHELSVVCKTGNLKIGHIAATETKIRCRQGFYQFGKVYGNLDFTNSEDSIIAPQIVVDYIDGNFELSAEEGSDANANPTINIAEVKGKADIVAEKGKVDLKKVHGNISILSGDKLDLNLVVADNEVNNKLIRITNQKGNINIGFLGPVAGDVILTTETGNVNVKVTSKARFISTAYSYASGDAKDLLSDGNITVNGEFELAGERKKNPLQVEGSSAVNGQMSITTNKNISYELVGVDKLM